MDKSPKARRWLAYLAMLLPALPLFGLGMTNEYWSRIYLLWGGIFAALSLGAASTTMKRTFRQIRSSPSTTQFFLGSLVAWLVSFIGLAIINFTPLCRGQDNGDGRNDLGMCILLTVLWPMFMSILIVPLSFVMSLLARQTARHRG